MLYYLIRHAMSRMETGCFPSGVVFPAKQKPFPFDFISKISRNTRMDTNFLIGRRNVCAARILAFCGCLVLDGTFFCLRYPKLTTQTGCFHLQRGLLFRTQRADKQRAAVHRQSRRHGTHLRVNTRAHCPVPSYMPFRPFQRLAGSVTKTGAGLVCHAAGNRHTKRANAGIFEYPVSSDRHPCFRRNLCADTRQCCRYAFRTHFARGGLDGTIPNCLRGIRRQLPIIACSFFRKKTAGRWKTVRQFLLRNQSYAYSSFMIVAAMEDTHRAVQLLQQKNTSQHVRHGHAGKGKLFVHAGFHVCGQSMRATD